MYYINPHIPVYYFNRKKQTEPVDYAEYDPWWNYPDKKAYTSEDEICERLDRETAIANCSKTGKAICHLILLGKNYALPVKHKMAMTLF